MQSSFAAKVDFPTGVAFSVVLGDVNGDGKLDLVVGGSGLVSVLLNTTATGATTPSFTAKVDFTAGTNNRSLALGDVNGDGKLDLAVTNDIDGTVSVLLNTTATGAPTPSFAAKVDFMAGAGSRSVAFGDVNGDGKPDLAVTDVNAATVSVLLNTTAVGATSPTFATTVDFTTGTNPIAVAFDDVNGDGTPDLAVVNQNGASGHSVSILLNTTVGATPRFATKVDYPTGTGTPSSVALGDLNGDGKPDLAVANSNAPGSVSILRNTTDMDATTPSFAAKVDFMAGMSSNQAVLGNLNGDGKPDLAVANSGDNTVSVFFNTTAADATASFTARVDFPTGVSPNSVAIGDFNGDGKLDLAVANTTDGTVSVLLEQ